MRTMDYVYAIVQILAGCGAFLLGFKLLSENMEKLAGNSLKKLFNKTSDKKFVGVGMGAVATAVVQSSAVTTVMVVGFVNAGIMSLNQAAAVIMGANIGTTVTAQIVALQSFDIQTFFMLLALVGVVFLTAGKRDKTKTLGLTLAGFGIIFVGLATMKGGIGALQKSESIRLALQNAKNPFLLLLIGIAVTALVQSSGAITAIVITMAASGLVIGGGGNAVLYVILGSNIGTCVTALLSAMGASVNARRASVIHLLFNVVGTLLFMVLLLCVPRFQELTFAKWFPDHVETQIAMFHTFFNVVGTLIFLPFTRVLVKVATALVPEKTAKGKKDNESFMDKRFLSNPAIAVSQTKKEIFRMSDLAMKGLQTAFDAFIQSDVSKNEDVHAYIEDVAGIGARVSDYLVQVSSVGPSLSEEKKINALHNCVGDIVRISELSDNLTKYTKKEVEDGLVFSSVVGEKLTQMFGLLNEQYDLVKRIVLYKETEFLKRSDEIEDSVDEMRKELIADHIARMERGECRPENNAVFINLVSNLERVGDHLGYIAHSMDNIA